MTLILIRRWWIVAAGVLRVVIQVKYGEIGGRGPQTTEIFRLISTNKFKCSLIQSPSLIRNLSIFLSTLISLVSITRTLALWGLGDCRIHRNHPQVRSNATWTLENNNYYMQHHKEFPARPQTPINYNNNHNKSLREFLQPILYCFYMMMMIATNQCNNLHNPKGNKNYTEI